MHPMERWFGKLEPDTGQLAELLHGDLITGIQHQFENVASGREVWLVQAYYLKDGVVQAWTMVGPQTEDDSLADPEVTHHHIWLSLFPYAVCVEDVDEVVVAVDAWTAGSTTELKAHEQEALVLYRCNENGSEMSQLRYDRVGPLVVWRDLNPDWSINHMGRVSNMMEKAMEQRRDMSDSPPLAVAIHVLVDKGCPSMFAKHGEYDGD